MGVNLESRQISRRYQREPVSGWSRLPDAGYHDRPVRIHTLGRFGVQLNHHAVTVRQTRQHRPIELLQALIALGGRDVSSELLSQALWPDADGDAASNTFDVTLHRLRRLLDIRDLLLLRDHRLTLNSDLAWVDAWAFERLINHAEHLLTQADEPIILRQLARIGERLLTLYRGGFLDREAGNNWSLALRERLRSKLLRHIQDVGLVWERLGEWEQAERFYRKGLEIDPLAESLYQRLMVCFRETGRPADAMALYQRCRDILEHHFQVRPSARTLELYASLKA